MKALRVILLGALVFLMACKGDLKSPHLLNTLPNSERTKVIMIFAPDCPMCLTYGSRINNLAEEFPKVDFYALLPGTQYSETEVKEYLEKTNLTVPIIYDTLWNWCESLGASVTPEFFVFHEGEIKYSGKMDDWAALIGRKRQEIKKHFLKDALLAIEKGEEIEVKTTRPVGCILEYE